ncbi:MAG: alpha-galactosidase, partial [Clostridium sp.]|nr:alpha-galactosidase [Clostridium sp.]
VERLKIQYGTSMCYPLSTMSNHVTAVPNHQIDRITPLELRNNVSTFGVLGYELDLSKLSEEELNEIKGQVDEYRERQKLMLSGTFWRLRSPFDGNETAWQVVSSNNEEILVGWYRVLAKPNQRNQSYLKLVGLENEAYYKVTDDDTIYSGSALMNIGIRLPYDFNGANQQTAQISGDFQSKLFTLKKINI